MTRDEPSPDRRSPRRTSVLTATAACFGLIVSGGVAAAVVAGLLQWTSSVSAWLDNLLPLVVLVLGMLLAGRVAVDVAGRLGAVATVASAVLVGLVGWSLSRTSEAHGDGIEPSQVVYAALGVAAVSTASAVLVIWRRSRG